MQREKTCGEFEETSHPHLPHHHRHLSKGHTLTFVHLYEPLLYARFEHCVGGVPVNVFYIWHHALDKVTAAVQCPESKCVVAVNLSTEHGGSEDD